MRGIVTLTWIAVSIVACTGPAGTRPAASPSSSVQATGILLVNVGEPVQARPSSEVVAQALSDAMVLAEANGDDLGYPWLDPATGELVLSVVTPHGRELAGAAGITVPHRTRDVLHGVAELRRIQDDVTFLRSRGVSGSELIYATIPDHRDNRALIVISATSTSLLEYLAAHYPADALAVEVDPAGAGGAPAAT
jgi:hypothetical protein